MLRSKLSGISPSIISTRSASSFHSYQSLSHTLPSDAKVQDTLWVLTVLIFHWSTLRSLTNRLPVKLTTNEKAIRPKRRIPLRRVYKLTEMAIRDTYPVNQAG